MAIDAVNAAGLAQGPALLLGHCFFGFGRKAALESSDNSYYRSLSNVRCYPESRHVQRTSRCPLSANSGHRAGYSITSSARPSSDIGTVSPRAFAVLRFMISSAFVD